MVGSLSSASSCTQALRSSAADVNWEQQRRLAVAGRRRDEDEALVEVTFEPFDQVWPGQGMPGLPLGQKLGAEQRGDRVARGGLLIG